MAKRKKLPGFVLFADKVLADTELKSVSMAARGLWVYMMCLMHRSPRRGYLMQENGKPYSLAQLAACSGCSTEEAGNLCRELVDSAVFSVNSDGIIFSRRMVREGDISVKRSRAGKMGAAETWKAPSVLPWQNDGKDDGKQFPSSLSSERVSSPEEEKQGQSLEGGLGETLPWQNDGKPPSFADSAEGLAQEFKFMQNPKRRESEIEVAQTIRSKLDAGYSLEEFREEIRKPRRDRSEHFFQIEKRLEQKHARNTGQRQSPRRQLRPNNSAGDSQTPKRAAANA